MLYRVDATVQGPQGNIEVVATCEFEAKTIAEAEAIADDWAKGPANFRSKQPPDCASGNDSEYADV
jgi:hypothetical protein